MHPTQPKPVNLEQISRVCLVMRIWGVMCIALSAAIAINLGNIATQFLQIQDQQSTLIYAFPFLIVGLMNIVVLPIFILRNARKQAAKNNGEAR